LIQFGKFGKDIIVSLFAFEPQFGKVAAEAKVNQREVFNK